MNGNSFTRISTTMGFNFGISLSGIVAGQNAISVTQTNISNAETQSYARERLNIETQTLPSGQNTTSSIGNGVISDKVSRIKDDILIQQSRDENGTLGYYTELQQNLSKLENVFSETSDGSITSLLPKFFNAWDELSKYPEEQSYRSTLIGQANQLAQKFNSLSKDMGGLKTTLDQQLQVDVTNVNNIIQKIADINNKIGKSIGSDPNSLYDERDKYIDELSKYVDVQTIPSKNNPNMLDVSAGGINLVSGVQSNEVKTTYESNTDKWILSSGNIEMKLTKGSIASTLQVRNIQIQDYKQQLDGFVNSLVTEVNNIHSSGYGLDNSTGINFFNGTDAGSIQVNSILTNNPEKIGTSSIPNTPGNSDQAIAISNLRDTNFLASGTMNPINFYQAYTIQMANDLKTATDNQSIHESVQTGIEQQRQNVQGVNIDEEMANLLEYQRFYQSNAKALKTVDDSFNALIQIM